MTIKQSFHFNFLVVLTCVFLLSKHASCELRFFCYLLYKFTGCNGEVKWMDALEANYQIFMALEFGHSKSPCSIWIYTNQIGSLSSQFFFGEGGTSIFNFLQHRKQ